MLRADATLSHLPRPCGEPTWIGAEAHRATHRDGQVESRAALSAGAGPMGWPGLIAVSEKIDK